MTCWSVRNQLSAHVDGRLSIGAARWVTAHLERCAGCREELAELRALKMLLAGTAPPAAPPGFWDGIYAGLREHAGDRERRSPRPWLAWTWRRAPAMAAGMAVLLLAAIVPVQYFAQEPGQSGVSIDEMVAHHAGYCARQPLLEHGRLHYLVAEAKIAEAE